MCVLPDEFGFCVVHNVLNASEVLSAEAAWGKDLHSVVDCSSSREQARAQPHFALVDGLCSSLETCEEAQIPSNFLCEKTKDFNRHCLPHGGFAWALRANANVRRVYEVLYRCRPEDLVVGLDMVFFSPANVRTSYYCTAARSSICSSLCYQDPPNTVETIWGHADHNIKVSCCFSVAFFIFIFILKPATVYFGAAVSSWEGRSCERMGRLPVSSGHLAPREQRLLHHGRVARIASRGFRRADDLGRYGVPLWAPRGRSGPRHQKPIRHARRYLPPSPYDPLSLLIPGSSLPQRPTAQVYWTGPRRLWRP